MKRRFIQWILCSGVIALVSLVGLVINGQLVFSIFEPLLRPWIVLCRAITPDSWQTMGNILLGLAWMGSGILVYSALFGAVATLLLSLIEGGRDQNAPERTASHTDSWWPFGLGILGFAVVTTILLIVSATDPIVPKEPAGKGMPRLEGIGDARGKDASGPGPVIPEEAVSDIAWRLTRWILSEEDYSEKHTSVHASLSSGLTFKNGRSQRDGWPHYENGHDWYALELTEELAASLRQSLPHSPLVENVPNLLEEIPGNNGGGPNTWPDGTACYAPVDRAGSWGCLIIPPHGPEAWFYREAH
jgi:hypothetical protein